MKINQLMKAKYGDLVGFHMGKKPIVIMSDKDQMVELFKQDAALGRGDSDPFYVIRPGGEGREDKTFPGKQFSLSEDKIFNTLNLKMMLAFTICRCHWSIWRGMVRAEKVFHAPLEGLWLWKEIHGGKPEHRN